MKRNGSSIASGTTLRTQVCIVGSGPAGLTLAWYLQKAGIQVTVLEGSRDVGTGYNYYQQNWPDKQLLYGGIADGQFSNNEPQFLSALNDNHNYGPSERERSYGGTSTHWGGQARPIDAVTFEGVPNYAGWPITRADLDPYYIEAATFMNLHDGYHFDAQYWADLLGASVPQLSGFNTDIYQFIGNSFLNAATRVYPDGRTIDQTPVDIITNASLLDINLTGGSISSLSVASMDTATPPAPDTRFTVIADQYVMAMGAVANARQLLLAGIKNDNIGRNFMAHALVAGYLEGQPNPMQVSGEYLSPSELNLMEGQYSPGNPWKDANGVGITGRFSPSAASMQAQGIGSCWFWAGTDNGGNNFYFEQAPNPDSRITLNPTAVDPVFQQPQAQIHWAFSQTDANSYNAQIALFKAAVLEKNPQSTFNFPTWDQMLARFCVNGHHMGTTRMSETAADGVVDSNLRSHDVPNLYIAGSSVWRSAGIPNPTFSIITFSIRLADHLLPTLAKGVTKDNKGNLVIRGKVGGGGPGYKVEAWDDDLITKDKLLGSTTTDGIGHFSITYDGKSHMEFIFDQKPDVYFKVYDSSGKLVHTTQPVRNADHETPYFVVSI